MPLSAPLMHLGHVLIILQTRVLEYSYRYSLILFRIHFFFHIKVENASCEYDRLND